ncbi:MAG: GGDEF domain-containing protein, partial [Burkholderiaceae bacterium]|nr:GGDEF domain-containing protein [Burkholderiaceae bacterium]
GDEALVSIAANLKGALRDADFAVRWGGEEFLIVLQNCTQEEGRRVGEKLCLAIETATPCASEPSIKLTISIGVCQFNGHESTEQMVNRADTALYSAKSEGRNRVCLAA